MSYARRSSVTPSNDAMFTKSTLRRNPMQPPRFLLRLSVFLGLATLLQAAIYPWNTYVDKPLHATAGSQDHIISARILDNLVARQPEILFLGDSTAFEMRRTARDQRTTYDLLEEALPNRNVASLCNWGFNMEMMHQSLDYLLQRGCTPSIVIAAINVRPFSPTWYYHPGLRFEELRNFYSYDSIPYRMFGRPLAIFRPARRFTQEEDDPNLKSPVNWS